MHRTRSATLGSARHALAHAVQVWAQSNALCATFANRRTSTPGMGAGLLASISCARVIGPSPAKDVPVWPRLSCADSHIAGPVQSDQARAAQTIVAGQLGPRNGR